MTSDGSLRFIFFIPIYRTYLLNVIGINDNISIRLNTQRSPFFKYHLLPTNRVQTIIRQRIIINTEMGYIVYTGYIGQTFCNGYIMWVLFIPLIGFKSVKYQDKKDENTFQHPSPNFKLWFYDGEKTICNSLPSPHHHIKDPLSIISKQHQRQ